MLNLKIAQNLVAETRAEPEGYGDHEFSYLDLLKRDDLDGVVIHSWDFTFP